MCTTKKTELENKPTVETSDSEVTSDLTMSDSEESEEDDRAEMEDSEEDGLAEIEDEVAEEEDEVIKAIRNASESKRDHPPAIHCEDFVTDISFHPHEDLLGVANFNGDVLIYKYSNDENVLLRSLEVHTKSCRDIEFSGDGKTLFSVAKDKAIMLSDVESGNLVRFFNEAHDVPIYSLIVIDENLFATGDDDGCVKLRDLRQRTSNPVFNAKKNEDYISDFATNEAKSLLLCSSGDGSLTTIDLRNRKIHMQSEEYEEDLTCLGVFRSESKLLAGSSKGKLYVYNWNEFGLHSDIFPGTKSAINDLIPITENIVVTACEDGILRATHVFPHRHLGIVGQHDLSAENLDICNNGEFIASSSHNNDIKFWNIKYFEDFEKVSNKHRKHAKKTEMRNNLPSSKIQNASDFFSGLC